MARVHAPSRVSGGGTGVGSVASANAGIVVTNPTTTVILTLGELDFGTLWGGTFSPTGSTTLAEGDIAYYSGSNWVVGTVQAGNGITLTQGATGPSVAAKLNGTTLSVGSSGLSLNLGNANTWTALQTFSAGDFAFGGYGADSITTGAKGDIWYYNGTNLVNLPIGSTGNVLQVTGGVPAWGTVAAGVSSVSNSDGTLTISPTTGAVVASLNLGNANTWTAAQTFDSSDLLILNPAGTHAYTIAGAAITAARTLTLPLTTGADTLAALGTAQTWTALQTFGTDISFLGLQVSGSPATSNFLQDNGSNWVGANVKTILTSGCIGVSITTTTVYGAWVGYGNWGNTTGANAFTPIPYAGTLKNFSAYVFSNSLAGADHITFTVLVYDTPGGTLKSNAITVQVTGGTTGVTSDTTHTASVSATWGTYISAVTNAGTGTFYVWFSIEFDQT